MQAQVTSSSPGATDAPRLWHTVAPTIVVAAGAALAVVLATRHGIGEGNDSSHYLSTAANLRYEHRLDVAFSSPFDPVPVADALAHGGRVPLTHFPPGYPVLLAVTDALVPGGPAAAARVVGAATIALLAVVVAVLARALGVGAGRAAVVAAVVVAGPPVLHLSSWAMSDASATTLALAALAAATSARGSRRPSRRVLVLAAGLAASAALVRYSGAAACLGVAVLVDDRAAAWSARVGRAAAVIGPTVLGVLAFLMIGSLRHGDAARPVAWHPPDRDDLRSLVRTVGAWLTGERRESWLVVSAVVVVALLAFAARALGATRAEQPPPARRTLDALAVFAFAHLAVLAITSAVLDTDVGADRRLLLPVEVTALVVLASMVLTAPVPPRRASALGALVLAAGLARAWTPSGALPEGIGAPPPAHAPNGLYRLVDTLPADTVLLSNAPEALWRETRRGSVYAPSPYDKLTGRAVPDDRRRAALVEAGRVAGAAGAVLVLEHATFLGVVLDSPRVLSEAQVASDLPCAVVLARAAEGVLLDLRACAG